MLNNKKDVQVAKFQGRCRYITKLTEPIKGLKLGGQFLDMN